MQIQNIKPYNMNFMAHYYRIMPNLESMKIIATDNEHQYQDPTIYWNQCGKDEYNFIGGSYSENEGLDCNIWGLPDIVKYYFKDRETGYIDDNGGKQYQVNYKDFCAKATAEIRKLHLQNLIEATNPGKTVGKLMFIDRIKSDIEKIDEPFIMVTPSLYYYQIRNPNLMGVIYTNEAPVNTSHDASQMRQVTDVCGAVYDPKIIERLKKFEGKNIEIELKDDYIRFNETDKKGKPKVYPKIDVPRLKYCDKILTSDEFTNAVIGAKAVNLRRLEELKEAGIIDVKIPKSIGLPYGYIEKLMNVDSDEEKYSMLDVLVRTMEENGIDYENVIVRSAFNSEDLPNYSAAGLYESKRSPKCYGIDYLFDTIRNVYNSKNNRSAKISRRRYQIDDDNVKPGEIIQDFIISDYSFTLYTDANDGKVRIELYSNDVSPSSIKKNYAPHIFTYDKKSGKLSYDAIQIPHGAYATFDENGVLVDIEPVKSDLIGNKKLFEKLEKVVQNALTVEREFGAPQDIEGGIKGDDIYFWQTRNLVM